MNDQEPKWKCPVCDKHAFFCDLQIDDFFLEVLQKLEESSDAKMIAFDSNLSFTIVDPASEAFIEGPNMKE